MTVPKHSRFAFVAAAALAMTVSTAGAKSDVTDGLLLTGTDAAYARFVAPVDDCHGLELVVGYVAADRLLSPLGSRGPHFHSDVDAGLSIYENAESEGCGSDALHLSGGRGLTESDHVEMVSLESATLDGFELTVTGNEGGDPVTVVLTLDLTWTGYGAIFTETLHSPGDNTAHRTVAADVNGTLTIGSVEGGGELAAALADGPSVYSTAVDLVQTEGVLTYYQQIIINIP